MKRKLLLLNLVLLALTAAAAWQLRVRWIAGRAMERDLLRPHAESVVVPPPFALHSPDPVQAARYSEVAQKMLFVKDRDPNVVVEVPPPKPVPAFPVAFGVVDFGSGPMAILSEKEGAASKNYSPGETVGAFKLLEVEQEALVLEWEGQEFRRSLQDLRPKSATPQQTPMAAAATTPVSVSVQATQSATVKSVATPPDRGPGQQLTGDLRACTPSDSSPPGTVRDGYRKVVTQTPFGSSCRWELVR